MKILALETSCEIASVALLCNGELHSRILVSPPAHSAGLLPLVRELLNAHKITLAELDAIAFGRGPGAFTGVRLACSVAQGLAIGLGLPVAPIDSLMALAEATEASQVYCAMDARMSEVYVARYIRSDQGWQADLEPACVVPSGMPVPAQPGWVGVGTAFRVYPECSAALEGRLVVLDANAVPTAAAVARLAVKNSEGWLDAAEVAPLYVRDRVALTVAERLANGGKA